MTAFMERSYRIGPDGRTVVCDVLAGLDDVEVLREAIAWRRDEVSRTGLEDVAEVLELRALMTVDDMLSAAVDFRGETPLTLTREQALILCGIAGGYVTARDVESYQPPEERGRIALLRHLAGPLMDTCCELAAAEVEARDRLLPV